jgi:hypothetical protein
MRWNLLFEDRLVVFHLAVDFHVAPDGEHKSNIVFIVLVVNCGEIQFDSVTVGLGFDLMGHCLKCLAD